MLWTSIRYMQECEGFRKDVTSINLSMMTYEWFVHKRDLLPMLKFPGEFHAASNSMHIKTRRAFTMKSFLDLNSGRSRIFLGGRLSYTDMEFEETYTLSPMGLASEFKQHGKMGNSSSHMKVNAMAW